MTLSDARWLLVVQIQGLSLAADQVSDPKLRKILREIVDTETRVADAIADALKAKEEG
jgi:hypothetical protein